MTTPFLSRRTLLRLTTCGTMAGLLRPAQGAPPARRRRCRIRPCRAARRHPAGHRPSTAALRDVLLKAIRECSEKMPAGILGQSLAGMWGPAWLFRQTGERGPLDKALAVFDHVLSQRPRTDGVLNWNGFMDDPLGRQTVALDKGMGWEQPTVSMRNVSWNEALHMQCGPLASLTRASGDARCITAGWLPRDRFAPMVLRGWEELKQMYWRKGFAAQCRGSSLGTAQYYASRPQGWGAVPQALMAAHMVRQLTAM